MANLQRNHSLFIINACALATTAIYLSFLLPRHGGIGLSEFLVAELLLALLWWGAYRAANHYQSAALVFFWALVFRLIGVWGEPIFEDDYYRYLWDGYRFITDGTPYSVAPGAFFDAQLPEKFAGIVGQINHPDLPTIYGPTLQYLFALAYLISPGELWGLKLLMLGLDLALIALLFRLAPPHHVLLYAWCPLVIKEIAFTAHPDGIGVFLLLLALFLRSRNQLTLAVVAAALAVAAKVFAWLLIPWVLWRLSVRYWLLFFAVFTLIYLPFLVQGGSDLFSLAVFARDWQFNAALYAVLALLMPDEMARILLGSVFLGGWGWYFLHYQMRIKTGLPRGDIVFALFLFVSPVINAWYWLWVLPFAVIYPSRWAWVASSALLLSYCVGLHLPGASLATYEIPLAVRLAEFVLVATALAFDLRHRRKIVRARSGELLE